MAEEAAQSIEEFTRLPGSGRYSRQPSWLSQALARPAALVDSAAGWIADNSHLYRWLQQTTGGGASDVTALAAAAGGNCTNSSVDASSGLLPLCNFTVGNSTGGGGGSEIVENLVVIRNGPLERMWWVVYWITAILTYVWIPVVQEYVAAGEFTRRARLKTSITVNLVFYAVIALVAAGGLAYVIFGAGVPFSELFAILITAANTYGLVLVVLLVGYGAAEVPRSLWQGADAAGELRRLEFQAPEVEATLFDARTQLLDVIAAVRQAAGRVAALETSPAFQSGAGAEELAELKRCLAIVQAKAILEQDALGASGSGGLVNPLYNSRSGALAEEDEEASGGGSGFGICGRRSAKVSDAKKLIGVLAGLHKKLMASSAKLAKTQFRWDMLVRKVMELECVTHKALPPLEDASHPLSIAHHQSGSGGGGGSGGRGRGASMYWGRGAHGVGQAQSGADSDISVVNNAVGGGGLCTPLHALRLSYARLWWTWRIWIAPYAYLLFALTAETLSLLLSE